MKCLGNGGICANDGYEKKGKKKRMIVKILKFYEITVSQWKTVFMS